MMRKINNLFEVNTNDTLGTAILKGAVKGYAQGVLAAGLGLGVLVIGVMVISNKKESTELEEELTNELDEEVSVGGYSPWNAKE